VAILNPVLVRPKSVDEEIHASLFSRLRAMGEFLRMFEYVPAEAAPVDKVSIGEEEATRGLRILTRPGSGRDGRAPPPRAFQSKVSILLATPPKDLDFAVTSHPRRST